MASSDIELLLLPLECSRLIAWWEAGDSADIQQQDLPLECSWLIEWWENWWHF